MSKKVKNITDRILNAIITRIEGAKSLQQKLDYLMNPEHPETSSILSDSQVEAVNEMVWLGDNFPTLEPLKTFALGLAKWSPSKGGKGREQLTATMVSETKEIIPMSISQLISKETGKKKK